MSNPLTETGFFRAIEPVNEKLDTTTRLLEGPPSEPHKGFIVRMDRVERISKALVWATGVLFATLVTACVAIIAGKLIP